MKLPMTVHELESLSNEVDNAFSALRTAQMTYISADNDLHAAKWDLARAIDRAYQDGAVAGKNEREREASLRETLSDLFARVDTLEVQVRNGNKALRDAEIATQRMILQVTLTRAANALVVLS